MSQTPLNSFRDSSMWRWLTGSGGLIVLVCFFLPMVSLSCAGQPVTDASAFDLATDFNQSVLFLMLLGALLALAATMVTRSQVGGILALLGTFATLLPLAYLYVDLQGEANSGIETEWQIGLFGLIGGAIIIAAGGLLALFAQEDEYMPAPGTYSPFPAPPPPSVSPTPAPSLPIPSPSPLTSGLPLDPTKIMRQRQQRHAWLAETNGHGRQHSLSKATTLGRNGRQCQIVLEDHRVSGEHARIRFENGQYILYDLASTNGTYWNGTKVGSPRPLADGDRVRVGQSEFIFKEVR